MPSYRTSSAHSNQRTVNNNQLRALMKQQHAHEKAKGPMIQTVQL